MKLEQLFINMDICSDEPIIIEAEIHLISASEGGRNAPVTEGYSPNHNFDDNNNRIFYIGNIQLKEDEWLYPGKSKNLEVIFMNVKGLKNLLKVGRKWKIQEASHLVGYGVVNRIISS